MSKPAQKRAEKKREGFSVYPVGPVVEMVRRETAGGGRGAVVRFFEEAVVGKAGHKYPELAHRYQILREEAEA